MMKPDFSKDGLKRFFLYHAEKIILGVSVLLMGLFFWLGFNAQPFKEKSPSDLASMAGQAEQYIAKADSWDQIREVDARKGETDLVKRIQAGNEAIEVASYPFGFWSIRAKTLSTRKDPQLVSAQDLVATHFIAPLFFTPSNLSSDVEAKDPLSEFPLVSDEASDDGNQRKRPGRDGDDGDAGSNKLGRGGLPPAGPQDQGSPRRDEAKAAQEVGGRVLAIHQKTIPGVRPPKWQISNSSEQVLLEDVVVVTGLVNVKQLKQNFVESFSDAVGYLPSRDKPVFKYLEVQRAEVSDVEPKWVDISEQISRLNSATPTKLLTMPEAEYPSAPEVVDPSCYDPVVTQPIPAFTQFDYRKIANHPTLPFRKPEKLLEEKKAETLTNIFGDGDGDGNDGEGSEESSAEEKGPSRLGSDTSKYVDALHSRKLKSDFKLVRFFDLSRKEPGKSYQYRVRLWVSDPNNVNADSDSGDAGGNLGVAGRDGKSSRGRRPSKPSKGGMLSGGGSEGAVGGFGEGPERGESRDGGEARGGEPRGGQPERGGGGSEGTEDEDAGYDAVELTPQMLQPEVRARLTAVEKKPDPKDRNKFNYSIQEPGYDALVQVPKGKDELRFCRPTSWSEPVKVTIDALPRGDVIAGSVEPPRSIRVGTFELIDGEPIIELVVAPWDRALRSMLPGRKKAYRGEALDFLSPAHVLNPVSWLVHKLENAPVFSQAVMVDLMGGNELALPRDDMMRYHTAAEILVMEPDGSLKVSNDLADRTKFKQALLLPDDPSEFGTSRERKNETENRDDGSSKGGRR